MLKLMVCEYRKIGAVLASIGNCSMSLDTGTVTILNRSWTLNCGIYRSYF